MQQKNNFHLKSNFDWDFESKFIETSIEVDWDSQLKLIETLSQSLLRPSIEVDSDFESDFDPKSESTSIEVSIKFDYKSQSISIASVSLGSESSESFLSILSILRISITNMLTSYLNTVPIDIKYNISHKPPV